MSRSCARGKSNASGATKNVLLAESGGYCQNPTCNQLIFHTTESGRTVHFAELAHIVAASPDGARGDESVEDSVRAAPENLLVLCANCHKIIDKAEDDYPVELLLAWKKNHRAKLDAAFGIRLAKDREQLRTSVDGLLRTNTRIHADYGPDSRDYVDPYDDRADIWRVKVVEDILPNNMLVVRHLERNARLLTEDEKDTLAALQQHVLDLQRRHLSETPVPGGSRWPDGMTTILRDEGTKQ
jgi:hypothetical protein